MLLAEAAFKRARRAFERQVFLVDDKRKAPYWGEDEAMSVAERLARNSDEDCGFADILDRFARFEYAHVDSIPICRTPYVLALGGADKDLGLIINPSTIKKCMRKERDDIHGHEIDRDVFKYLIYELRRPAFLLKGTQDNSLVAVTDSLDKEGRPIVVSISKNRRAAHHLANQITSAYGRNNFGGYLHNQIKLGNLIAFNMDKAPKMLEDFQVRFPFLQPMIVFDNSIAYTLDNVKTISVGKYRNFSDFERKEREQELVVNDSPNYTERVVERFIYERETVRKEESGRVQGREQREIVK